MCGIAGLYGIEKVENAEGVVQKMLNCMTHRGPDAEGLASYENTVLGHRRLSIIDLDARAHQPMEDENASLVFNGEIYNYKKLKSELSAKHSFRTDSDTEVLLKAYSEWGMDMLPKLEGMFAFALFDKKKLELYICRDRLGIKPCYLARTASGYVFASEVRAILASGLVPKKLNKSGLAEYLRYQTVHDPNTIVQGVSQLPAGSYVSISDTGEKTTQYWSPVQPNQEAFSKKRVRELLEKAVEKRMMADVPLGAFLSGGIDSSAVVGLMAQQSSERIHTFSIGFEEAEFSEHQYAEIVSKKFNTQHHPITLRAADFKDSLPEAVAAIDHPSGDGPNSWVISKKTKEAGVTVALSGLGGDELFAGYPYFQQIKKLQQYKGLMSFPKEARILMAKAAIAFKGEELWKLKDYAKLDYWDVAHTYPVNRRILPEKFIRKTLTKDTYERKDRLFETLHEKFSWGGSASGLDTTARASLAELETYMRHVLLRDTDQMSMASSLEVRVPFLDHQLVSYILSIPESQKFGKAPKDLLVRSLGDILPDDIVYRQKMGFTLPWSEWLRKDLKGFAEEGLDYLGQLSNHFDQRGLQDLWRAFLKGSPVITWSRVWHLVALGHWCKNNGIDG